VVFTLDLAKGCGGAKFGGTRKGGDGDRSQGAMKIGYSEGTSKNYF